MKALVHFAYVLLDHVGVVQKPFPGRAHVDAAASPCGEPLVRVVEDPSRVTEAKEERALPRSPCGGCDTLVAGDRARAIGELIGSQELAAQRAREEVVPACAESDEESGEAAELF